MAGEGAQDEESSSELARLDIDAYNSIVSSAALRDIRLTNLKFDVKAEYYSTYRQPDGTDSLIFECDCEPSVDIAEQGDFFAFVGTFEWKVRVRVKRKPVLNLKAVYLTYFSNPECKNEHAAEVFVKRMGQNATYPYLRALVNIIGAEAKADLPALPILTQMPIADRG